MHNKLIKDATLEQLKIFLIETFNNLKIINKKMYDELEEELYINIYGRHFNDHLLKKATEHMVNEDGTTGAHWTLEQTNQLAKQYSIDFNKFNEYDFNFVMNMIYSDYYGAIPNEMGSYVKIAMKFLNDKDSNDCKAFNYYYSLLK